MWFIRLSQETKVLGYNRKDKKMHNWMKLCALLWLIEMNVERESSSANISYWNLHFE